MSPRSHPRPPTDPASLNGAGSTMWTNLGLWERGGIADASGSAAAGLYPQAAAALARRVGAAAQLMPGDVVVDYACGFGDSLRLWVEEFGVHSVVGVEPASTVCQLIDARVHSWGLADRIRVICASAEDIAPSHAAAAPTAVVCVDAAYHFQTRAQWLRQLGADATTGLRLGIADLSVPAGRVRSLRLAALARLMRIPRVNLKSSRDIALACEDAGFSVATLNSVSVEVLDGFVNHAPRGSMPVAITRAAIAFARRAQLLDYLVIGAKR